MINSTILTYVHRSLWAAALAFPFQNIDLATPGFLETLNYTDIVFQLSKPVYVSTPCPA